MQKILIIVAIVASLAAAGLGYQNRLNFLKEREIKLKTMAELDATKKTLAKTAAELKAAQEKIALLNSEIESKTAQINDLTAAKAKLTEELSESQKQNAEKDSKITQLNSDIAAKDAHIKEIEEKLAAAANPANDPTIELKKQIEEKDLLNTSLQAKIRDLDSQVATFKEREAKRKAMLMKPGLEGRILAVNSSWNFVVLSLGDRNGVVNGAEMLIKRGSQLIGKVRITSVEPSTSIADIVPNSIRGPLAVQPGDSVIYSGPSGDNEVQIP
jgi:peptidoglycan hydrolase CwlO-like protein